MHEAQFYTKLENHVVRCDLCPWNCELKPNQTGICKVRSNENGRLFTHVFQQSGGFWNRPDRKKTFVPFSSGKKHFIHWRSRLQPALQFLPEPPDFAMFCFRI